MILTDTSVAIPFARGKEPKLATLLATLPAGVCGITRAEALHGARNPAEQAHTLTVLNGFLPVPTPESIWDTVGDNLALMRSRGIIVPFTDMVIATIAIDAGLEVWTRDKHFPLMQSVLPALRLFVEPP